MLWYLIELIAKYDSTSERALLYRIRPKMYDTPTNQSIGEERIPAEVKPENQPRSLFSTAFFGPLPWFFKYSSKGVLNPGRLKTAYECVGELTPEDNTLRHQLGSDKL